MIKVFLIVLVSLFCMTVYSQTSSDVRVTSVRSLNFNNLLPGVTTTISTINSNAGRFVVDIRRNLTIAVTFTLPSNLTSGTNNLPVTFTATKSTNSNDGTLGTSFNPYTGTTITRTGTSTRNWYLRLGGTVQTPTVQQGGNYSGSIILTLSFIGN